MQHPHLTRRRLLIAATLTPIITLSLVMAQPAISNAASKKAATAKTMAKSDNKPAKVSSPGKGADSAKPVASTKQGKGGDSAKPSSNTPSKGADPKPKSDTKKSGTSASSNSSRAKDSKSVNGSTHASSAKTDDKAKAAKEKAAAAKSNSTSNASGSKSVNGSTHPSNSKSGKDEKKDGGSTTAQATSGNKPAKSSANSSAANRSKSVNGSTHSTTTKSDAKTAAQKAAAAKAKAAQEKATKKSNVADASKNAKNRTTEAKTTAAAKKLKDAGIPAGAELMKTPVSNRIYYKADGEVHYVTYAQYKKAGKPKYTTVSSINADSKLQCKNHDCTDKLFKVKGSDAVYYQFPDGYTLHLTKAQRKEFIGRETTEVQNWPSTANPVSSAKSVKETDTNKIPAGAQLMKSAVGDRIYYKTESGSYKYITKAQYVAAGKPSFSTVDSMKADKLFRIEGKDAVYYQYPDGKTVHLTTKQRKELGDRKTEVLKSWPKSAEKIKTTTSVKGGAKTGSAGAASSVSVGKSGIMRATVKPGIHANDKGPRANQTFSVPIPKKANGQLTGAGKAVAKAVSYVQQGVMYAHGNASFTSPAGGLDCSTLTRQAVYAGSNGKIKLSPHAATQTREAGVSPISRSQLKPGDLIESRGGEHISMYIGVINGTPMYASATYDGRPADIGPLSALTNIVSYGHPNYDS